MNARCLEFDSDGQKQPFIGSDEFSKQRATVHTSH
jgi:hypothetical protein